MIRPKSSPVLLAVVVVVAVNAFTGCSTPAGPGEPAGSPTPSPFLEDSDPQRSDQPARDDELLAEAAPGADPSCAEVAFAAAGLEVRDQLPALRTTLLRARPGELESAAAALRNSGAIERVQRNYRYQASRTPRDSYYSDQTHWVAAGFPAAWETVTGHDDVVVAVLDTGIDDQHPDLAARISASWNAYDGSGDASDPLGHGTAVAGLIGAVTDNGAGVAGATWAGRLLCIRVSDDEGVATAHSIAKGLVGAVDRGADVINISFAPLQGDRTIAAAIEYAEAAGVSVFISAGNDGERWTTPAHSPAVFVGAQEEDGSLALFSTRGPFVDLAAPGVTIWTTARNGHYTAVSGTSFASPIAAGAAALLLAINPNLTPADIRTILADSADDLGAAGRDEGFGAGGLRADRAVALAVNWPASADGDAPELDFLEPADGATVSGLLGVEVDVRADQAVTVVLSLDGQAFASDRDSPYHFVVDTRGMSAGEHTLSASGRDAHGREAAPVAIQIEVAPVATTDADCVDRNVDTIPPAVAIQQPQDGVEVLGTIGIKAVATDDVALRRAALLVDGQELDSIALDGQRANVSFVWEAASAPAGEHQVVVRVSDAGGQTADATLTLLKP
jgi:subtilisin family serine protease